MSWKYSPTACKLLPLSFTPSLITVILSTIDSRSFSRSRTLLLVLSIKEAKLLSPVISLPVYALSTGSESLNASILYAPRSHLPTKLSSKYSLFIRRYSWSATVIILSKNNWSLLSLCFTLFLKPTSFIFSSTSFWYQFPHFLLTYSLTHHFFLFWFTTLLTRNFLSFSLPA